MHIAEHNRPKITRDSGIIILLLGETGAGRSSFVNAAAGRTLAEVSDDLDSCTLGVEYFVVRHPKDSTCKVVFVDTPGFSNSSMRDGEVLGRIIDWLKISCCDDVQFGGIIYLHDLTDPRGGSKRGAITPTKLSRPEPARRVVLATMKGSGISQRTADFREDQLKRLQWKKALEGGSQMRQFTLTEDSAWSIVDIILERGFTELRPIQDELDKIYRTLPSSSNRTPGGFFSILFGRSQHR